MGGGGGGVRTETMSYHGLTTIAKLVHSTKYVVCDFYEFISVSSVVFPVLFSMALKNTHLHLPLPTSTFLLRNQYAIP